jgi:hypothetical protein
MPAHPGGRHTKERIVSTTNRKKFVSAALAAAAAVAAPAALFLSAGTAQAETAMRWGAEPSGFRMIITSYGMPGEPPSSGRCTYTAVPVSVPPGVFPPLPVHDFRFHLPENESRELFFPGIQTGTTWNVTVHCQYGTDSPAKQVVF